MTVDLDGTGPARRRHAIQAVRAGELAAPRRLPGGRGGHRRRGAGPVPRRAAIDLVVLDVRLPDLQRLRGLRADQGGPGHGATPVIHVSAAAIHVGRPHAGSGAGRRRVPGRADRPGRAARHRSPRCCGTTRPGCTPSGWPSRLASLARISVAMNAASSERELLRERRRRGRRASSGRRSRSSPTGVRRRAARRGRAPARRQPVDASARGRTEVDAPLGRRPTRDEPPEPVAAGSSWPADGTVRVLTVRPAAGPAAALRGGADRGATDGRRARCSPCSARRWCRRWTPCALFDEEHDLALTLQRSLLPQRLPQVPGLDLAVRYVPAGEQAEIGGDFYEVARFGDQLMVAVGDVGGHSLHAATVMAELRHATRAYLAEGHGPAAVIDRLNHLMAQLIPGEIATLCLLAIDIHQWPGPVGQCRPSAAGPAQSRGGVRLIHRALAAAGHPGPAAPRSWTCRSPPGDTIVLYTDGLIETRIEPLDESLARLVAAAEKVEPDLEVFASRLLADVGRAGAATTSPWWSSAGRRHDSAGRTRRRRGVHRGPWPRWAGCATRSPTGPAGAGSPACTRRTWC